MQSKYKLRIFTCIGCGTTVEKHTASNNTKYCSLECYRSSSRPNSKKGKISTCLSCGTSLYVVPSRSDQHFCNVECHKEYQSRDKTEHICIICNTLFYWSPSRLKNGHNVKYCSLECRDKDPNRINNLAVVRLKKSKNTKPNNLELMGKAILDRLEVDYIEQKLIANKFIVDAFIPSVNLGIQWDGDYWHGYGLNKDIDVIETRILTRMNYDKSQDAYMKKCGYNILRFWEHEVKQQPEKVYEHIAKTIRFITDGTSILL